MLDVRKLHELENSVAIILCNLEKIFPPAFFSSMEHLIVHLPYEARVRGPVQYRWMYPFERFLHELKKKYRWVDPVRGMKVYPSYHLIDVNFKKLYQKDDPFILAQQAVQLYFMDYPSMKKDKADWMTVCKIKAWRVVDDSKWIETVAYQPEEVVPVPRVAVNNQSYDLRDPNGLQVVLEAAGTSQRQLHENDDENEDEDSDRDESDDDEYKAT
ncbi:UNVERIFIED_CONTAM: hypothetical protein Sradi_6470300 [Sesamum radiatum]|uniref:DUF4218 domain-containing protein n=1 Tax=Sesamum radiatum TaxID=300843 RepID=A0AAW2K5K1_SESRA